MTFSLVLMAQGVTVMRDESDGLSWEMALPASRPEGLAPLVSRLIGYEEHPTGPQVRREVPTAGVTVILGFGDPISVELPTDPSPIRLTAFVAGMQTIPAMVASADQRGVQLDLTPLGAFRLFGLPMSELANQVVPLDAVRGRAVTELIERLASTASWSDRFALLDAALLRWADEGPEPDRPVSWAWDQLRRSYGQVPIGLLVEEIGWSRRHFINRFRDQVGLAPKSTGRVLRFRRAVDLLGQPSAGKTLASVAALCGYADQSHMNRDFHALAGCRPTEYLATLQAEPFGDVQP